MKKSTVAILAIGVIAAVIIVAMASTSNEDDRNISYNYEIEDVASFNYKTSGGYPLTSTPDVGNKYIVAHVIIKNESYGKDASMSLGAFKLKCSDNISYLYDIDSINYSSKSGNLYDKTLGEGASYDLYIVFEVPSDVTAVSLDMNYSYSPYSYYHLDTDLSIPAWVYPSW